MERYDANSGLVYRESVVHAQAFKHREHEFPLAFRSFRKPHRSSHGADSLAGMLVRKLACNARILTPETLHALPFTVVERIWKGIRRDFRESFIVWKTFVEAGVLDHIQPHQAELVRPRSRPLVNYFIDMRSVDFKWLVDLNMYDLSCSQMEFKTLAELSNLQNLTVLYSKRQKYSEDVFNDSTIEALASRAAAEGALGHLRTVFIDKAEGVSNHALHFLHHFRSLELFCVLRTMITRKQRSEVKRLGWDIRQDSTFASYAKSKKLRMQYEPALRLTAFRDLSSGYIHKMRSQEGSTTPVLKCLLGQPEREPQYSPTDADDLRGQDQNQVEELAFERNWEACPAVGRRKIAGMTEHHVLDRLEPRPVTKRRKIKESRRIELDRLLEAQ